MRTHFPSLSALPDIRFGRLPQCSTYNPELLQSFRERKADPQTRLSHFHAGRYENIYMSRQQIPEIAPLLQRARAYAGVILGLREQQLRCGFWFNEMAPGQVTSLHSHDEIDELLSGVYYLSVPRDSGDLLVVAPQGEIRVHPEPGLFVFFPPETPHQVTRNESTETRISIAFNFGPSDETAAAD